MASAFIYHYNDSYTRFSPLTITIVKFMMANIHNIFKNPIIPRNIFHHQMKEALPSHSFK